MTEIQKHNAPLKAKMEEQGFKYVNRNGKAYYVDKNEVYQPYPVGYITGPSLHIYSNQFYASVQGKDGWLQRDFKEEKEAIQWAIKAAQDVLNN